MINYEYYKVFYYCCKYMNFTKAAAFLSTSQSSVSHTMNTLEFQLGCRLFSRNNRGIKLTPDGEQLYSYVSAGCEMFIKGENEIISGNTDNKGIVYLSTTETALNCFLFDALNTFNEQYPDIKLKIENLTSYAAAESVKSGVADFAILTTPIKKDKCLKDTVLIPFTDILVCGERFKTLTQKKFELKNLSDYPYISLCNGTVTRSFYDNFLESHHIFATPDTEVATSDMIIPMVKNNVGISFVPDILMQRSPEGIYPVEINHTMPQRCISLILNLNTPKSPAAKSFYKFVCDFIKK